MTPDPSPSRRRALHITAAAAGLGLAGIGLAALAGPDSRLRPQTWRGIALGADASITIYHPDPGAAALLIRAAVQEITRLERIFSLYRADSALTRLNRRGILEAPPLELVDLLAQARTYSEITDGVFDVTVQPLWRLYAGHFAEPDADPSGPPVDAVRRTRALVDYRAVEIDAGRIAFARPGMAITLNGIAQGWITDRVAELLGEAGLRNLLVNLGEIRALGAHPDGRPWTAGLRDAFARDGIARTITLGSAALATSAGYGYQFDRSGRHNHLFDPRSGQSSNRYASVSVIARTATAADALSTAIASMDRAGLAALARRVDHATAIITGHNGATFTWRA